MAVRTGGPAYLFEVCLFEVCLFEVCLFEFKAVASPGSACGIKEPGSLPRKESCCGRNPRWSVRANRAPSNEGNCHHSTAMAFRQSLNGIHCRFLMNI